MWQEYSKRCPNQIFRLLKKGISLRLESICEPNSLKCTKRQAKCSTVSQNACLARYIPNIWKIIVQINEFDSEKHYFIAYIVQINEFCPFFTQVVQNDEFGTSDGRATRARRPCHPRQTAVPPAPGGRATRARRPCHPHRPTASPVFDPVAPIDWSSYPHLPLHNTHPSAVAQDRGATALSPIANGVHLSYNIGVHAGCMWAVRSMHSRCASWIQSTHMHDLLR